MKITIERTPKLVEICNKVRDRTNAELEARAKEEAKIRHREQVWYDLGQWAVAVKEDCADKSHTVRRGIARGLRRAAKRIAP